MKAAAAGLTAGYIASSTISNTASLSGGNASNIDPQVLQAIQMLGSMQMLGMQNSMTQSLQQSTQQNDDEEDSEDEGE